MDAYDDLEKDRKIGSYNPFIKEADRENFDDYAKELLTMMAAEATVSFERLPVIDYVDILRNVLYSGIWTKYRIIRKRKTESD